MEFHEVAAVIPFGFTNREPEARRSEDLDARLHVDAWRARAV